MKNVKGPLLVRIVLVNATKNHRFGQFPSGEEYGPYDNLRDLYKDMRKEWGGKVSKMYRDTSTGTIQVGWVFTSRQKYTDDPNDTYLREAWVEVVREIEPATKAKYETLSI